MKVKNIILFSLILIILTFSIMGLSFAHPGHGSEYPEEVSSASSHSSSQSSSTPKTTSKTSSYKSSSSSNHYTTSKQSSSSKSQSSSSKSQASSTSTSNSQDAASQDTSIPEEVGVNDTNDSYDVEEVLSSNNTQDNNQSFFSMTNILLMIGAFIIGFIIMALIFKFK